MRSTHVILLTAVLCLLAAGCGHGQQAAAPAAVAAETSPAPAVETSPAPASHLSSSVAAGTVIPVFLGSVIDTWITKPGFVPGKVAQDVAGADGRTAIPAGSHVTLVIRQESKHGPISTLVLGLFGLYVEGSLVNLSDGENDVATITMTDDAGKGAGHTSIHLDSGRELDFKTGRVIQLH